MCIARSVFIVIILFCSSLAASAEKKYGQGEYEIYSEVTKDLSAANFTKAIAGLEAWSAKHPNSDFKNNRQVLSVQAFYGSKQPAKVIDAASALLSQDAATAFETANDRIRVLYMVTAAVQQLPEPTDAQRTTALEAARQLAAIDQPPSGTSAADWERARTDLRAASTGAILYVTLTPIAQTIKKGDCAAAESSALRAVQSHASSAAAYRLLASAQLCLGRSQPEKFSPALFAYARASVLDPANAAALERMYTQYHGSDPEGLKALKDLASREMLPPPGFVIKSSSQIEQEKQAAFESKNPELALWIKIRHALAGEEGAQYFTSTLKDSAVPQLFGTLIAVKPACRPTELHIAIQPASGPAEIALKLAKPLNGKPELNRELRWEGVASAFTKEPFLLTMDVDNAKIDGLKLSPCAPARR